MKRLKWAASLPLLALALTGCSGSSISSTQEWMKEQERSIRPTVKPLPEPKQYVAVDYVPPSGLEPFSAERLIQALSRSASGANSALLQAEQARRKEPLEAYPLDAMAYVGSLHKDGQPVALVRVDNLLYQVRVGQHMGQNFGRVTQIKEEQITLHEVAQDAAGEWVERTTTLDLQEGTKS